MRGRYARSAPSSPALPAAQRAKHPWEALAEALKFLPERPEVEGKWANIAAHFPSTPCFTLLRRDRRIAESLALGNHTSDVARRFKVCAGRVSQLRRELAESWQNFVGEEPPDDTAALVAV